MLEQCTWLNEPGDWHLETGILTVTTDRETDFWRETHYGFTRDSGHFFGCVAEGDFTAELRVRARYEELYDQAGIMVRIDEAHWVKAGSKRCKSIGKLCSELYTGTTTVTSGRAVVESTGACDGRMAHCPFPFTTEVASIVHHRGLERKRIGGLTGVYDPMSPPTVASQPFEC